MATKPSCLTLGGILLQQASTTREAERYKIHPAKPGPPEGKKGKGKGPKDSCLTHTKMQAGGWQREMSDNSTWSSWASPLKRLLDLLGEVAKSDFWGFF